MAMTRFVECRSPGEGSETGSSPYKSKFKPDYRFAPRKPIGLPLLSKIREAHSGILAKKYLLGLFQTILTKILN